MKKKHQNSLYIMCQDGQGHINTLSKEGKEEKILSLIENLLGISVSTNDDLPGTVSSLTISAF